MITNKDKDKINAYIEEGRRRFGNNLHDIEIFGLGCIYADSLNKEGS